MRVDHARVPALGQWARGPGVRTLIPAPLPRGMSGGGAAVSCAAGRRRGPVPRVAPTALVRLCEGANGRSRHVRISVGGDARPLLLPGRGRAGVQRVGGAIALWGARAACARAQRTGGACARSARAIALGGARGRAARARAQSRRTRARAARGRAGDRRAQKRLFLVSALQTSAAGLCDRTPSLP